MGLSRDLLTSIQNDIKSTNTSRTNSSRINVPGAHRIDSIYIDNHANGHSLGVISKERRAEDEYLSRLIRSNITGYNKADNTSKILLDLQSVLSDPSDPTKSKLVVAINDFFSKAIPLTNNHDISSVQNFITQGVDLANTLSVAKNKINQLRYNADQDLSSSLQDANKIIKQIYDLNQVLVKSPNPSLQLLDDRDKLLNDLAEQFSIKVSFGNNGMALVATEIGGTSIIGRNQYAKFSYLGLSSQEQLINGAEISPVVLNYTDQKGRNYSTNISVIDGINNNNTYKLQGGKIASCAELRDVILPNSLAAVDSFSKLVVDNINALHNNASPYPPKTSYTSSNKVSLADSNLWNGTTTISMVDANGRAVNGSSGPFKPITINLAEIANRSNNGLTKVQDIITEINSFLNYGPPAQRISLGEFPSIDSAGNTTNKYLLNDIKLAGKSDIEQGNFTFDLDLDGSNFFGSKIEILDVQTDDAGVNVTSIPTDQLPTQFNLEKNAHLRTHQPITINGLTAGIIKNVNIKVRVIGDNGVTQEGIVNFKIDPNQTDMLNKRITGSLPVPAITGNKFVNNGPTHSSIARAKLVDDNGVEIGQDSIYTKGRLVIESVNNQYGLVISNDSSAELGSNLQGITASNYGFTQFFGLNNFFEYDNTSQKNIAVRSDIANDVSKLSIAVPSNDNGVRSTVKVGNTQATGTLNFTNINPGGDFATNDTIVINGVTLTFSNTDGPLNVLLGGNMAISLDNLVSKINSTNSLKSVISATRGGGDDITLTAIKPGTSGNNIAVAANLNAAGDVTVGFNSATAGLILNPSNLTGGGDRDESIITYGQSIGRSSTEFFEALANLNDKVLLINAAGTIPATNGTLHNYASTVGSFLANQTNDALTSKTTKQTILQKLTIELKEKTGIDDDQEYLKSMELYQSLSAKYRALGIQQRLFDLSMEIFSRF